MPAPHDKRYCGAKKRQGDGTCRRPPGWGTSHPDWGRCKLHGGSGPDPTKAAEAERLDHEVRTLFGKTVSAIPIANPLTAYAAFAGRVMAWMNAMDELLDDVKSPRYGSESGEQIRGEVQLFERSMDRCNAVLSSYARLKIDERLVRIAEEQKQMVLQAIDLAFATAGVSGSAAADGRKAAARHLRSVA
jgi:hypothetical protein